ncbi:putative ribonucleotide transport ATP-binding protein mkl [Pontiella desulfatans]|uniref:Putative ribonucleotide transport ATP-binding protein mkl n=2 Tax=Pontiella desulfatans TaxID=2750659 RepID=A0A6C2U1T0_PONDE|nr:ATP-binding cassette domain-containing protein [Pontiella desulfatans]VGO13759.1 putative ribonucleotide transport ATP-binding protein mkl [Pontiella desulfatans]
MSSETIISVENMTARYGERLVLDSVSLEVNRGEIFVILGGSGCGKSTLLKHMIGLYKPCAGDIRIGDVSVVSSKGAERDALIRRFGVMYQSGALFGSMTLLENICLPLEEFTELGREARELVARMKLSLVGLADFANHMPSEISGGMKKRAAIARAMALDPEILFLDEPSAGLDPVTADELDELIIQLSRSLNITFVIVTHELPSIYKIADRIIMLDARTKKIIAEGNPAELRETAKDVWVRNFFNRKSESVTSDT